MQVTPICDIGPIYASCYTFSVYNSRLNPFSSASDGLMCILGCVGEIGIVALCFGCGYRSDDAVRVHRERRGIKSAFGWAAGIIRLASCTWAVRDAYQ